MVFRVGGFQTDAEIASVRLLETIGRHLVASQSILEASGSHLEAFEGIWETSEGYL